MAHDTALGVGKVLLRLVLGLAKVAGETAPALILSITTRGLAPIVRAPSPSQISLALMVFQARPSRCNSRQPILTPRNLGWQVQLALMRLARIGGPRPIQERLNLR